MKKGTETQKHKKGGRRWLRKRLIRAKDRMWIWMSRKRERARKN